MAQNVRLRIALAVALTLPEDAEPRKVFSDAKITPFKVAIYCQWNHLRVLEHPEHPPPPLDTPMGLARICYNRSACPGNISIATLTSEWGLLARLLPCAEVGEGPVSRFGDPGKSRTLS